MNRLTRNFYITNACNFIGKLWIFQKSWILKLQHQSWSQNAAAAVFLCQLVFAVMSYHTYLKFSNFAVIKFFGCDKFIQSHLRFLLWFKQVMSIQLMVYSRVIVEQHVPIREINLNRLATSLQSIQQSLQSIHTRVVLV